MAAQAGLCLAWSETPEDAFCRGVVKFNDVGWLPSNADKPTDSDYDGQQFSDMEIY